MNEFVKQWIHQDIFDKEVDSGEFSEWLHCVEVNLHSFANWLTVPKEVLDAVQRQVETLPSATAASLAEEDNVEESKAPQED